MYIAPSLSVATVQRMYVFLQSESSSRSSSSSSDDDSCSDSSSDSDDDHFKSALQRIKVLIKTTLQHPIWYQIARGPFIGGGTRPF